MKERTESKPLLDFSASLFCLLWAVGDLMALWDLRADSHCHWGLSSLRLLSSLFLKKVYCIEVLVIYSVVFLSVVQQNASIIHIYLF